MTPSLAACQQLSLFVLLVARHLMGRRRPSTRRWRRHKGTRAMTARIHQPLQKRPHNQTPPTQQPQTLTKTKRTQPQTEGGLKKTQPSQLKTQTDCSFRNYLIYTVCFITAEISLLTSQFVSNSVLHSNQSVSTQNTVFM